MTDLLAAASPPLVLAGVTKIYNRKTVLDSAELSIPQGSVVGLLGQNAAGKTTLIKCALGLVRPDVGTARIFGENAWNLSAAAKAMLGYVPQIITLYPWMRVRQIINYVGAFYPKWNDALVWDLMRQWGVDPEEKVGVLSVG